MFQGARLFLAFRYDDFSERSPTDLEAATIDLFQQYGLPLTIGVIPYLRESSGKLRPIGLEKAALARTAAASGTVELALHGYAHEAMGKDRWGRHTEFSGLPYGTQRKQLLEARSLLEERTGIIPRTFIPPWNSYDLTTLTALAELGFRTISAGRTGESDPESNLAFLPATARLAELRTVAALQLTKGIEPVPIVVLFHDYDFVERDQRWGQLSFEEFEAILEWVADQPQLRVLTLDEMARKLPDLTASRYAHFTAYHDSPLRRLLPSGWTGSLEDTLCVYVSEEAIRVLRRRRILRVAALFGLAIAGSALLGVVTAKVLRLGPTWSLPTAKYLGIAISGALVALAVRRGGNLYFKAILALATTLAILVGLWLGA